MNNSSRGLDNLDPKLLKRFPMLREIQEEKGRLGPIRVLRKSPKEIKKVLEALPNQYFDFEYYDCQGDALQFGYEDHLILWTETKIKDVPTFTQTVIYLVKEDLNMTIEQLNGVRFVAEKFEEIISVQVSDITPIGLDKIADKVREIVCEKMKTIDAQQAFYLKEAKQIIIDYHMKWKPALKELNKRFGLVGDAKEWEGVIYHGRTIEEGDNIVPCTLEDIGDNIPIVLHVEGEGGLYGFTTSNYDVISKEEFLAARPVMDLDDADCLCSAVSFTSDFGTKDDIDLSNFEVYRDGKLYTLITKDDFVRLADYFRKYGTLYVFNGC